MLTCFAIFLALGLAFGKVENLYPLVAKPFGVDGAMKFGGMAGFFAVLAITAFVCCLAITATLVVPASAGSLKPSEHLMFGGWIALGLINWIATRKRRNEISIEDRTYMVLGEEIKKDLENAIQKEKKQVI